MVLVLILLLHIDNQSLDSWLLQIRPNSFIGVLPTVGKASMMVPIAACLSQLKWRHYLRRPDRLHSFQLFDDASRGPWGSMAMLFNMQRRALLACSLALVTLAALGIDPSAQQILDFPMRETELRNATARLGRADNYTSKSFPTNDSDSRPGRQETFTSSQGQSLFWLQSSLLAALIGQIALTRPALARPLDGNVPITSPALTGRPISSQLRWSTLSTAIRVSWFFVLSPTPTLKSPPAPSLE